MAAITFASSLSNPLIGAIAYDWKWNAASLQYYFGGRYSLNLDSFFESDFQSTFSGLPDDSFYFAAYAERAYRMVDSVIATDFSRTDDTSIADFVLVSVNNEPWSTIEGFFEFPDSTTRPGSGSDYWSLGAFNSGAGYLRLAAEKGGGQYSGWTIIHEIGHSLGLLHTHDDNTGDPLPEVGKWMDNERYSVMSYNGASAANAYGHAVSLMALDIAALQARYGTESYATGNSTYTLYNPQGGSLSLVEDYVAIGRAYYCIWDSGGDDTIRYDNSGKSVLINLNDATLDTSGWSADVADVLADLATTVFYARLSRGLRTEIMDEWHHAGGFFSRVLNYANSLYTANAGGYSIAHGAQIENAVGGSYADLLIGNEGNNILTGKSGNDTMLASGGDDTLYGGTGNDTMFGGTGADTFVFSVSSGRDVIRDYNPVDVLDLKPLGYTDVSQVSAIATDLGSDIRLDFSYGNYVVIKNVELGDISVYLL